MDLPVLDQHGLEFISFVSPKKPFIVIVVISSLFASLRKRPSKLFPSISFSGVVYIDVSGFAQLIIPILLGSWSSLVASMHLPADKIPADGALEHGRLISMGITSGSSRRN